MCGVKDRSKVMLIEDPASIENRANQMRRNMKIQTAHRAISDVCLEVDKLAEQVSRTHTSHDKYSVIYFLFIYFYWAGIW